MYDTLHTRSWLITAVLTAARLKPGRHSLLWDHEVYRVCSCVRLCVCGDLLCINIFGIMQIHVHVSQQSHIRTESEQERYHYVFKCRFDVFGYFLFLKYSYSFFALKNIEF